VVVPNGYYRVDMRFAEITASTKVNGRVFAIALQGRTVVSGVDVMAAVGLYTAYDLVLDTYVDTGRLDLDLIGIKDAPGIQALSVSPLALCSGVGTP
jgi:hypothetical protein